MLMLLVSPVADNPVTVRLQDPEIETEESEAVACTEGMPNLLTLLVVTLPKLEVIAKPVNVIVDPPLATTDTLPKVDVSPGKAATADP